MKCVDTPAGKFQILINRMPGDFTVQPSCCTKDRIHEPAAVCYQISMDIRDLTPGDVLTAGFERGLLRNDGGGEGMDNALCAENGHVVGIGAPDTAYLEWNPHQRILPYESLGLGESSFSFRILDDPAKYPPQHRTISFLIAWKSIEDPSAWEHISLLTS